MKLPNADHCVVHEAKALTYLLCLTHPSGRSKAKFFLGRGFRPDEWRIFAEAMIEHGRTYDVFEVVPTEFGVTYTVEGPLTTPDGRSSRVRSVWMIDRGQTRPRLISAYPAKG